MSICRVIGCNDLVMCRHPSDPDCVRTAPRAKDPTEHEPLARAHMLFRARTLGQGDWDALASDEQTGWLKAADLAQKWVDNAFDLAVAYIQGQEKALTDTPIPMRLHCPACQALHIDEGEFATRLHHTHACQHCGNVWRPAVVPTVGVRFLPGFRNETEGSK